MENIESLQSGEPASASTQGQTNPPLRILVVDDDENIRRFNAEALSRFGYQTETAADGAAAWEALQANGYDLLITDHNMPNMSGVELVRNVRSAGMALPVIVATGTFFPTSEFTRCPWLQSAVTLLKPHTIGELLGTVEKALAQPADFAAHRKLPPVNCQTDTTS